MFVSLLIPGAWVSLRIVHSHHLMWKPVIAVLPTVRKFSPVLTWTLDGGELMASSRNAPLQRHSLTWNPNLCNMKLPFLTWNPTLYKLWTYTFFCSVNFWTRRVYWDVNLICLSSQIRWVRRIWGKRKLGMIGKWRTFHARKPGNIWSPSSCQQHQHLWPGPLMDTKDRSITRKRLKEVVKEDNTFKEQVEWIQQGFPG